MIILLLVLFASLCVSIYNLLGFFIEVPSFQYVKYVNAVKKSAKARCPIKIIDQLKNLFLKLIRLSPDTRERLSVALNRCNIKMTPDEYYLKAISLSVSVFLSAFAFIAIGIPVASLGSIFLSVLVYFQQTQSVHKKLEEVNNQILDEMPGFIRSFSSGLKTTRDIVAIIEKYRLVAKPALANELDILITNLKTENHEEALKKFDQRLNLEPVSTFVSGVIGISRGIDYKTYFYMLEENMKTMARENMKREVAKRPRQLKKAIWAMILVLFLLYMLPIIIQLQDGFNIFNN